MSNPDDSSPTAGSAGRDDGQGEQRGPVGPDWLPWGLYALVTAILFREFLVSGQMLMGTDTLSLGYVARDFFARALDRGIFPLWNPLILGGTPFLESLIGGDSLYPPSLGFLLVTETYRALGWKLILHVFLAGLFMYGWVRALGRSRAAALLAGLAYLMAPFLVTLVYPGHDGKIFVTALTPLLFWVTERAFAGRSLLTWVGVAVVVALVILTTHFQMAYFLFGAVGFYAIFRTVRTWWVERRTTRGAGAGKPVDPMRVKGAATRGAVRGFGLFLAASLLGAALSGIQLLPAVDYVTDSSRRTATTVQADEAGSVSYSSSWSLHPEEIASLVVPEFVGSNVGGADWASDTYWGRNPFKLNHEYAGLVVLLLAAIAFLSHRGRPAIWFFTGLGTVGLLYALGAHTPVWRIFYEIVPGVRLFRAPSMAIFLFGFAAVTLSAFGIDRALEIAEDGSEEEWKRAFRILWIPAAVLGALTVMAATGALMGIWTTLFDPGVAGADADALAAASPHIARGFFFASLLVGATAATWWAHRHGVLGKTGLVGILAVLIFADALRVDEPFIQTFDFAQWAAPTANIRFLQERQEEEPPFRVLSMVQGGQDVKPGLYGLELAAGHHPNDLASYRELIGMRGSGAPENLLSNQNVLRILNVRYLLWPDAQYGPLEGMERVSAVQRPGGAPVRSVYEVPGLPRARLVGSARIVPGPEAVDTILASDFDPENEVVLSSEPPVQLPDEPVAGEVRWEERTPNRLALQVRNDADALLVIADNWYPSWEVRVDGASAPLLRANHTLRAVPLEAGEHRVEMVYASTLLARSLWISLAAAVVLLAAAVGSLLARRRREGER